MKKNLSSTKNAVSSPRNSKKDQQIITEEERDNIKKQIEFLDKNKRLELAKELKEAADLGDLSENEMYTNVKKEIEMLDIQISGLRNTLKNAQVVKVKSEKGIVNINDFVKVKFLEVPKNSPMKQNEIDSFQVVGSTNADPINKKYSSSSKIGQAILGKKIGEESRYETGFGDFQIKIIEVKD